MGLESKVRLYYMNTARSIAAVSSDDVFLIASGLQHEYLKQAYAVASGVDAAVDYFTISGNHTAEYPAGTTFMVRGTAANDGDYTVHTNGSAIVGNKTRIYVTGTVADASAGGYLGKAGFKAYHSHTASYGWCPVSNVYQGIRFAALTTPPAVDDVLVQNTSGATLVVKGYDTTTYPIVWGIATGTWNTSNTVTSTGSLDPDPATVSSLYTAVKVTTDLADQGSYGSLHAADYIEFDMGRILPRWTMPGERIQDRRGIIHRITPPTATRFCTGGQLIFPTSDYDTLSYNGLRLPEFIEDYVRDTDQDFILYAELGGEDSNGTAYTERRYYAVNLEGIPDILLGNRVSMDRPDDNDLVLEFICTSDGEYTDFDNPTATSYIARSRT